jgi:hypothetical protein
MQTVDRLGFADIGRWASPFFFLLASDVGKDTGQHPSRGGWDGEVEGGMGGMRWDGGVLEWCGQGAISNT